MQHGDGHKEYCKYITGCSMVMGTKYSIGCSMVMGTKHSIGCSTVMGTKQANYMLSAKLASCGRKAPNGFSGCSIPALLS